MNLPVIIRKSGRPKVQAWGPLQLTTSPSPVPPQPVRAAPISRSGPPSVEVTPLRRKATVQVEHTSPAQLPSPMVGPMTITAKPIGRPLALRPRLVLDIRLPLSSRVANIGL